MAIIVFPLLLSFDHRVMFFRQWRAVFPAILITSSLFIADDIIATGNNVWSFHPQWAGEWTVLSLPPGEWLFFLSVPYACIFIYACIRAYVPENFFAIPRGFTILIAFVALIGAFVLRERHYSRNALIFFAVSLLLITILYHTLFASRQFWLALIISFIAFIVVNGILTSIPVVVYNSMAIVNIRIGSIPMEDFLYNFALLTVNFFLYRIFLGGLPRKNHLPQPSKGEFAGPGGLGSVKKPVAAYNFMRGKNGH